MTFMQALCNIVLIGCGATAVMDLWVSLLRRMGVQTLNFAFVGRWVGHMARGRFVHAAIREARPVAGELALGWFTHYAIGVLFAGVLVAFAGPNWMSNPTIGPALAVGIGTVVAPLFIMQPAMGSGFAASRTPAPFRNCLRSVINHTVFGGGLYAAASLVALVCR